MGRGAAARWYRYQRGEPIHRLWARIYEWPSRKLPQRSNLRWTKRRTTVGAAICEIAPARSDWTPRSLVTRAFRQNAAIVSHPRMPAARAVSEWLRLHLHGATIRRRPENAEPRRQLEGRPP